MQSKIVQLHPDMRFHARPAGILAAKANRYDSVVMLMDGEKFADAKNFVSVMGIGKPEHAQVELIVDGVDEIEALKELEALLITLE